MNLSSQIKFKYHIIHIIGIMSSIKRKIRKPCLMPRHKGLCMEWLRKSMAEVIKTVLLSDRDHARRWSSVVPREDWETMAQLYFSGTSSTCQLTFSVFQVREGGYWPHFQLFHQNHNRWTTLFALYSHSTIITVENPSFNKGGSLQFLVNRNE